MKKIVGRFYFEKKPDGSLEGECSHNLSSKNSKEIATPIQPHTIGGFLGDYESEWENGKEIGRATLTISIKPKTDNTIYSLIWKDKTKIIFWGEAIEYNEALIGDYRNFESIK